MSNDVTREQLAATLATALRDIDLDGMCEAFSRIIEAQAQRTPFHQPANTDAAIALRLYNAAKAQPKQAAEPVAWPQTVRDKGLAHKRLFLVSEFPDMGKEDWPDFPKPCSAWSRKSVRWRYADAVRFKEGKK